MDSGFGFDLWVEIGSKKSIKKKCSDFHRISHKKKSYSSINIKFLSNISPWSKNTFSGNINNKFTEYIFQFPSPLHHCDSRHVNWTHPCLMDSSTWQDFRKDWIISRHRRILGYRDTDIETPQRSRNDPHMSPSIGVTRRRMNWWKDPRETEISREDACSVNYSLHSHSLLFSSRRSHAPPYLYL